MAINPDFADGTWEEPEEDDFYEQMGVTPEEAMSAAYDDMLARVGLDRDDIREMASRDGEASADEETVDSGIMFDATRSLDGHEPEVQKEPELPFPEVEHEQQLHRSPRLQARHNEPIVAHATRHIPNKPDFGRSDEGVGYEK